MNSSNDQLGDVAAAPGRKVDPGFTLVVAFTYYDGPEEGLALFPSGQGVKFFSLGDSSSRLFRAFEFVPLSGNWWRQARALPEFSRIRSSARVLVPSTSDALDQLKRSVVAAEPLGSFYVGV